MTYEIAEYECDNIFDKRISVLYNEIHLEGLIFKLSSLLRAKFVVLAKQSVLQRKLRDYELEYSTVERALEEIQEQIPEIRFRFAGEVILVEDCGETDFDLAKATFARFLCRAAKVSRKTFIVATDDMVWPKLPVLYPISYCESKEKLLRWLGDKIGPIRIDVFEDFIYIHKISSSFGVETISYLSEMRGDDNE